MQVPTPKVDVGTYYFAKNCMKMKEYGPHERFPGIPLRSATVKGSWLILKLKCTELWHDMWMKFNKFINLFVTLRHEVIK